MSVFKSRRIEDSTFDLNLAPMLDIIVSIVPMLLMSLAFVHVTVIDTPVPQTVEKAIAAANEKNKDVVQIALHVSKKTGFRYSVTDHGQTTEHVVALAGTDLDLKGLQKETMDLKKKYPDVFRLELNPEESVDLNEIVGVMDQVRTIGAQDAKVVFKDVESGKSIETNLVFPDIVFGNVAGG
jgi:biopolymer transport protein ExbD